MEKNPATIDKEALKKICDACIYRKYYLLLQNAGAWQREIKILKKMFADLESKLEVGKEISSSSIYQAPDEELPPP